MWRIFDAGVPLLLVPNRKWSGGCSTSSAAVAAAGADPMTQFRAVRRMKSPWAVEALLRQRRVRGDKGDDRCGSVTTTLQLLTPMMMGSCDGCELKFTGGCGYLIILFKYACVLMNELVR